jgi:hypothetical protein
MGLPPRRRNVVVWRQSAAPASRPSAPRPSRIRRWARIVGLLTAVGLLNGARAARVNWPPVAGSVLTVGGMTLRGGAGGLLLLIGAVCLLCGGLLPPKPRPVRAGVLNPTPGPRTTARR